MVHISKLKNFARSPVLIALIVISIITVCIGAWYLWDRFSAPEPGANSTFSDEEIDEALGMAEQLIVHDERYKEIGGQELKLVSFDSDEGDLLCTDCEGVVYAFKVEDGETYHINVGFVRIEDGSIDITNADIHEDGNDTYFIDLLTGDTVPLVDLSGPEAPE